LRGRAKLGFEAFAIITLFAGVFSSWVAAVDDQICDMSADLAFGREDYPVAIRLHRRLLQSRPDNALMHYHLGFAYGMSGRSSEELKEYLTSARLGLRTWDLFLNLGLAYFTRHELAYAADALETAVSLGPKHPETHFNLALAYENENRMGDALREITAARRLAPNDPDIPNTNAIICAESGDLDRARDIWRYMVQLAPDYEPAGVNLSILNRSSARTTQLKPHTELSYDAARKPDRTLTNP
jgi:Flp pilus assembly protein TadD